MMCTGGDGARFQQISVQVSLVLNFKFRLSNSELFCMNLSNLSKSATTALSF